MRHTNLNYHTIAYEKLDHYLRNVIEVLSHPPNFFKKCLVCANDFLRSLPDYLNDSLSQYHGQVQDCRAPEYPYGEIGRNATADQYDENKED